jgi:LPS-assembly lipoprotein
VADATYIKNFQETEMLNSIPGIKWITLLLTLLFLGGCGYQLRQAAQLPASISPIIINGIGQSSALSKELAHRLKSDTVQITRERAEASTMLNISSYKQQNRTLSVDETGKVAQTELKHTLTFSLIAASGETLVPAQTIVVTRDFINTEQQKLGKVTEAGQLAEGMQQELARQIITRIQAQLSKHR